MCDVGEALVPDALANERRGKLLPLQNFVMHPHDENLFIVRPVEDADPSPFWKVPEVAPHEVVVEAFRRGLLDGDPLASLWVTPGHDMLDRPVIPSCVHSRENEQ